MVSSFRLSRAMPRARGTRRCWAQRPSASEPAMLLHAPHYRSTGTCCGASVDTGISTCPIALDPCGDLPGPSRALRQILEGAFGPCILLSVNTAHLQSIPSSPEYTIIFTPIDHHPKHANLKQYPPFAPPDRYVAARLRFSRSTLSLSLDRACYR